MSIDAINTNTHITDKDFLAKIVNIVLIYLLYYTPKTIKWQPNEELKFISNNEVIKDPNKRGFS